MKEQVGRRERNQKNGYDSRKSLTKTSNFLPTNYQVVAWDVAEKAMYFSLEGSVQPVSNAELQLFRAIAFVHTQLRTRGFVHFSTHLYACLLFSDWASLEIVSCWSSNFCWIGPNVSVLIIVGLELSFFKFTPRFDTNITNKWRILEFMARRRQSTQARDGPWLWNPGETSSEVRNRGISGPTKRTHVLQKIFKKIKN